MSFIRFKLHFLQRSSSEKSVAVEGIDRMMEMGGIFLILLIALLSIAFFGDSDRPVPVHFDAGLHADAWGDSFSYLVLGGFGVLITLLCLWASRYPRFINLPVVMHSETEQMQNFMKCRYARVLTLLIGLMFLSLLLLCRAMQLEKAWAWGSVSMLWSVFIGNISYCSGRFDSCTTPGKKISDGRWYKRKKRTDGRFHFLYIKE